MPPRALLFDFDGVLADTENVHIAAWERTFDRMGWIVPPAVCARAAEEDDRAFLARVFAERAIEGGDVEGWVRRKQELTRQMLTDAPRLYPGVPELIARVRGRVRLGVVSTTCRENIRIVLEAARLADAFELIVGKEDVAAVKPDPEAYRLAVRRLGLPAEAAVGLEDAPDGLAAARAAGLRCVAVGHRRPPGDWAGEARYVPGLADPAAVERAVGLG